MPGVKEKLMIRDIPFCAVMTKIPREKAVVSEMIGINVRDWDFVFTLEDDMGNITKVWGSTFSGDQWNMRWQDDEFDYQLDDEAVLLWQRTNAQ
jgi:hypothetical protein